MALRALSLTALALGVGAAVTGLVAHLRHDRFEAAYPPVGQFVEIDGQRVHYVQEGSGPHVVMLHGAGGNLRDFTFHLVDALKDRYTVTAFDRPGAGYTDHLKAVPPRAFGSQAASPLQQVGLLREAARALGVTDPILVGHSFGGIISMAWAVDSLDRADDPTNAAAVVSLSGVLMPWPGELDPYYKINGSALGGAIVAPLITAFVPKSTVDEAIAATFAPLDPPDGYVDYLGGRLALRLDAFRANARQVNTLRPYVVDLSQRYPDLALPIEVVHGVQDTTVPMAVHPIELMKILDTVHLTPLEGAGHQPHHADPQATIDAIDRAAHRAGLR